MPSSISKKITIFVKLKKLKQKKRKEQWSTMKGIYLALAYQF
jgi:hypothetical protein